MMTPETETKRLYLNDLQFEAHAVAAHTSVVVAGRRSGKSVIMGMSILRDVQAMPRSAGAFVAATFQQALTRTLPGALTTLGELGLERDIHYVIGRKPPRSLNFPKPIIEPANYDRAISFYNGTVMHIISQDVTGSANSLTLDWIKADEARYINHDKLKDDVLPANGGGNARYFGNCPWHNGLLFLSDMPQSKKGSWFLQYENLNDEELITAIKACLYKIRELEKLPKSPYRETALSNETKLLNDFRKNAVYYRCRSTIENIAVVGERYIAQMKRDLPPLIFQTSILCKRLEKLKDGFYSALNEDIHYYEAVDNSYLQSLDYDFDKAAEKDCRQDSDLDPDAPICVAFDYNSKINWLVAGQRSGAKMKTLKSFYVKYERKIKEAVNDFCDCYRFHRTREVIYYYDNTALDGNYAVNDDDFAGAVCDRFERNGWHVTRVHIGNPLKHKRKYLMIDRALKGEQYLFPTFNRHNNEALLTAMQHAGIVIGSKGFQKDKSGEKLAETPEDLLEYRTDGTDAWDTLFIGMNMFPQSSNGFFLGSALGDY